MSRPEAWAEVLARVAGTVAAHGADDWGSGVYRAVSRAAASTAMSADEYQARLDMALQAARLAVLAEPRRALDQLDQVEVACMFVDPTLYRDAAADVGDIRALLRAVADLADVAERFRPTDADQNEAR